MSEITQQMAGQIFESIKEVLDGREMAYDEEKDEYGYLVTFDYKGEDSRHRMLLRVRPENGILTLMEYLGFSVDTEHLPDLLDAINRINADLLIGTFYYDYDGSVAFYNPLLFNNSIIATETVDELILRTVRIIEQYDDKLAAVNKGYLAPEKVVD